MKQTDCARLPFSGIGLEEKDKALPVSVLGYVLPFYDGTAIVSEPCVAIHCPEHRGYSALRFTAPQARELAAALIKHADFVERVTKAPEEPIPSFGPSPARTPLPVEMPAKP